MLSVLRDNKNSTGLVQVEKKREIIKHLVKKLGDKSPARFTRSFWVISLLLSIYLLFSFSVVISVEASSLNDWSINKKNWLFYRNYKRLSFLRSDLW